MGFSSESYTFMTMCRRQKINTNYLANFKFLDNLSKKSFRRKIPLSQRGLEESHKNLLAFIFNLLSYNLLRNGRSDTAGISSVI